MLLVDTNVVSEMRKVRSGRAEPNFGAWIRATDPARLFLSAIVVEELEIGVLRLERRDPTQGALLRRWLDGEVLPEFAGRILPVDTAVARRSAALSVPDPRPFRDGLMPPPRSSTRSPSSPATDRISPLWAWRSWTRGRGRPDKITPRA